jgi:hypothetical protein
MLCSESVGQDKYWLAVVAVVVLEETRRTQYLQKPGDLKLPSAII